MQKTHTSSPNHRRGRRLRSNRTSDSGKNLLRSLAVLAVSLVLGVWSCSADPKYTLVGWNDLGMHCTDGSDFSVFSILPHYNVIHAQLMRDGELVTNQRGYQVTYQAVTDPQGSINTTSAGKGNFYDYVKTLYGADLQPDQGLAGFGMPGLSNRPQAMHFEPERAQYSAEGIPITPYDDYGVKNYYPLMRLTARDRSGRTLATTDIVLPVSDEMNCQICHGSGTEAAARPSAGWENLSGDPDKDYKLNVLRLHDERHVGDPTFITALADAGYSAEGLYASAKFYATPILCARCHGSNALPGTGLAGISAITQAIHAYHAHVTDPANGFTLESSQNRASCYRCHPGSETRCLRGAMGSAVAPDGSLAMQCQDCHGSMSRVGHPARVGWLDQPNCQACHTGTAVRNSGEIRYTSALDESGELRQPADDLFATNPDTPAPGFSLYRFSQGHGGLQCEACHGSTHAEYPGLHGNDNLQSLQVQGHAGTLGECMACHSEMPETINGGPHGMHPVGEYWVDKHKDPGKRPAQCAPCHGLDYRGTVLSRSFADRTLRTTFGVKTFFRGSDIGCYNCHNGPFNEGPNRNRPPQVADSTISTTAGNPASVVLQASDNDGDDLVLRIVNQPGHGTVGLVGDMATYYPEPGFIGEESFTFTAWDGSMNSNLGLMQVEVIEVALQLVDAHLAPLGEVSVTLQRKGGKVTLSWPGSSLADCVLESSPSLGAEASWTPVTATPISSEAMVRQDQLQQYFRFRRIAG